MWNLQKKKKKNWQKKTSSSLTKMEIYKEPMKGKKSSNKVRSTKLSFLIWKYTHLDKTKPFAMSIIIRRQLHQLHSTKWFEHLD